MGQFIKILGLAGAGALLLAATPVLAGGPVVGHGGGGPRMVGPGRPIAPPSGPGFRPGPSFRPGAIAGRPPVGPGFDGARANLYGARGRFGYDYGYAYPRGRVYGPGHGGWGGGGWGGGFPGSDVSIAMPFLPVQGPDYPDYPPPYPVGYRDGSYAPTGYGVIYNVPPPMWSPPKIIYIKGDRVRRVTYIRPRQVVVVRGSASVD
jgi:hypothetical protein